MMFRFTGMTWPFDLVTLHGKMEKKRHCGKRQKRLQKTFHQSLTMFMTGKHI